MSDRPASDGACDHRRLGPIVAVAVAAGVLVAVVVVGSVAAALLGPRSDTWMAVSSARDGVAQVGAADDGFAVWDRNRDGTPVRWDPCRPIEVVVDPTGGPVPAAALVDDVGAALADLRAASGLELVLAGTTHERAAADRSTLTVDPGGQRRWAPVLVAWVDPHEGELPLRDSDRAIAIPVAAGPDGDRTYVTGQVALNRERTDLLAGRGDRATSWGATVLHELAHVLGLAHVDDPAELLYVHPGEGPVELGPGDRAGLAAVGAAAGCRRPPAPRELDVSLPDR